MCHDKKSPNLSYMVWTKEKTRNLVRCSLSFILIFINYGTTYNFQKNRRNEQTKDCERMANV